MDERRARIHDDLRGCAGGALFEPLIAAPYAHDASLYEIDPLGVIVPADEDDVVSVVRYAAENRIPLHLAGAGTDRGGGVAGAGAGPRPEPAFPPDRRDRARRGGGPAGSGARRPERATGAAGAAAGAGPERQRSHHGRGDDRRRCGGPRSLRYGTTGDQVDRLRVVFAKGEIDELGFEPWPASTTSRPISRT